MLTEAQISQFVEAADEMGFGITEESVTATKLIDMLRETAARLLGAAHDAKQGVTSRARNPVEIYDERADEWSRQADAAVALLVELGEAE